MRARLTSGVCANAGRPTNVLAIASKDKVLSMFPPQGESRRAWCTLACEPVNCRFSVSSASPAAQPPNFIFRRHAHGAWPVACRLGRALIDEEHAVPHIPSARDGLIRRAAVEAPVDALPAMSAERSGDRTPVGLAIGVQQGPELLAHCKYCILCGEKCPRSSRSSCCTSTFLHP